MNMKRIICLLLIVILTLSMAACNAGTSTGTEGAEPPSDQTQGSSETGATNKPAPTEPELVLPDAPTEGLSMMEYDPAYNTLADVTEMIGNMIYGIPSSAPVTAASVTEFFTNDELQGLMSTFDNVGSYKNNTYTLDENGIVMAGYHRRELKGSNNRYFFLANADYSAQIIPEISRIVYREDAGTLYVILDYKSDAYVDHDNDKKNHSETYDEDIARNSVAGYGVVALNMDNFDKSVEHIVFVTPEEKSMCRTDINVSVVPYDAKYQSLPFFDSENNGIYPKLHSFPSTKAPETTGAEFITSREQFASLLTEYSDIVSTERDYLIFEPGYVRFKHRANGLQKTADQDALLNLFISAPELDPYASLRCESFWIEVKGQEDKYLCGQFYDADTDTVYIYIGYNGQPHSQYEDYHDKDAINENSKATYMMMSVKFYNDAEHPVSNVVIVLPDPATVPAE